MQSEDVATKLLLAKQSNDTRLLHACLTVAADALGLVVGSKDYPDLVATYPEILVWFSFLGQWLPCTPCTPFL